VVATSNPGKLREFRALLADLGAELLSQSDFPGTAMPEEGDDYAENAARKARAIAAATGHVALADDSGLEVDGLDGRPGPHSARYGGPGLDDAGRVARLLQELDGQPGASRSARFVCVAAVAGPDGRVQLARGECLGEILPAPRGEGGFGYDPVFFFAEDGVGMAELAPARKNEVSHRARALRALRPSIEAALAAQSGSGAS